VNISRLTYRSRQFWNALLSPSKRVPSEALLPHLNSAQIVLFRRMQPAEQVHAYQIFKRLESAGQTTPDLLTAALLHDVGKILVPLSIFDRVLIVLGKYFFRKASRRWAEGTPHGLRLPFVVAEHHAGWGADLACQAGATQLSVELIRRHQDTSNPDSDSQTEHLLAALQAADDES
jgi:HD domain